MAAAIHVACRRGRWGSSEGERYSRHWDDTDRLARAGNAEAVIRDRRLTPWRWGSTGRIFGAPRIPMLRWIVRYRA